ncbi:MAG: hypothetical protein ACHQFX_00115 [Chitinophagales bacterium]
MNIWVKSILPGLVLAAVYFLFYEKITGRESSKSYRVHYHVKVLSENQPAIPVEELMNQAKQVIERRIINEGYDLSIHRLDLDELDVVITGAKDSALTRQIIQANNKIEFREVYNLSQLAESFSAMTVAAQKYFPANSTPSESGRRILDQRHISSLIFFSIDQQGSIIDNGTIGRALAKDTALISRILHDAAILQLFPGDIAFYFGQEEDLKPGETVPTFFSLYAIRTKMQEAELQNKHIEFAEATTGFSKQPELYFRFNISGTRIWERMTTDNKGKYIAIIIDKKVISAPRVNEPIYKGNSSISGGLKMEEVEMLARQLNSGYLPGKPTITSSEITGGPVFQVGKKLLIACLLLLVSTCLLFVIFNRLKRN